MKIKFRNEVKLQIIQPDLAHKAQTIIFFAIGFIGSVGVILSGEGLLNGIVFYILLIVSFIWFRFGGKSDLATLDKKEDTLEIVKYNGKFSKPKISSYSLADIKSCELDGTHYLDGVHGGTNRKLFGIIFIMQDGTKLSVLPYTNGKKKCEAVFNEIKSFIAK